MRGSLTTMVEPDEGTGPSFEEDLAYLLLFSEVLLDLIPDGVAVLDDRLRVRNANRAFVHLLGLGSVEAAKGVRLGDEPLLRTPVSEADEHSLADALQSIFESDVGLTVDRLDVEGTPEPFTVRAAPWDTEHPQFRRILLCVRRREPEAPLPPPPPVALPGEPALRPFTVAGWTQEVLERLPAGVCVLDPSHQVRGMNRWLGHAFGRPVRPEDSADRHLFALLPELRTPELTGLLAEARTRPDWVSASIPVELASGEAARFRAELRAFADADGEVAEILVILHDDGRASLPELPEAPPPGPPPAGDPGPPGGDRTAPDSGDVPVDVGEIVEPANLGRFPPASMRRIQIVEPDPWTRMVISVSLRQAGYGDLGLSESFSTALAGLAPDACALLIVGLDRDAEGARDFCQGAAQIAPHLPVLGVTERGPEEARVFARGLPLLGVLSGPVLSDDLRRVVDRVLRRPEPSAAPSPERPRRPPRPLGLVILGAGEEEVSVLRLLYRVQRIDIRLVWDSDPAAFGISLAKNLGIPTVAGDVTVDLQEKPDAVVLARDGLEPQLETLGLTDRPRITRDDLELFLVDPESYLDTDRTPGPPPPENPHRAEARPTYSVATPPPEAAPPVPPASESGSAEPEMTTLLGALDLLMDFDRLCGKVVEMALEAVDGVSGSLMLIAANGRELRIAASSGLSDMVVRNTRVPMGEGVAGRVAELGMPLLLSGELGDDDFFRGKEARPEIVSAITVPVVAQDRIIGVVNVNARPGAEPFDEPELARLTDLGRRVGHALERSRQLRRMQGRTFETSVRAELETIAATGDDILTRLRSVAERVVDLLEVDTCSLYLWDAKRGELGLRAVAGMAIASMDAVSVPTGKGLVGWVAAHRRPLLLQSAAGVASGRDVPCALGVPVRHRTELVGVLAVESTTGNAGDEERLPLFEAVASVVGQAVGESHERVNSERKMTMLSALSELGPAFASAAERGSLARLVTFSATTLLGAEVATIRLVVPGEDPGARELSSYEVLAVHGASVGPQDPLGELERRIARDVVLSGRALRESDCPPEELEALLERANVAAALGVPMLVDDRLVGVLMFFRVKDPKGRDVHFGDAEIEIGTRLGDHAAAAAGRFLGGEGT